MCVTTVHTYTNDTDCKVVKLISPAIREDSSLYYSYTFYL